METQKKQTEKLMMKKKVTPSWCGKCLKDFDLRYMPVAKKGAGKGYVMVYGICNKCEIVTMLRILKPKEMFAVDYMPKKERYKYKTTTHEIPSKTKKP